MPFRSLNFKVGLDLGNVKRGFSRIDRLAGKTARTMRGVFSAAATGATALAAGITLAAGAYLKLNQQVADSKNQLLDASTRTGIAAETLSGLRLAAEGSGLEFKALEGTLGRFTKTMNDAAEGLTEAQRGFQALGVEAVDSEGNMRDTETVLRETIDALNGIEDPALRAAKAAGVFGSRGTKLLQALSGGELDDFVEKAREFGVDVGPDAAKAAADWQRSLADVKLVSRGLADQLATAFGTDLLKEFSGGLFEVSRQLKANKQDAEGFGDALSEVLQFSIFAFGAMVDGTTRFRVAVATVVGLMRVMLLRTQEVRLEWLKFVDSVFGGEARPIRELENSMAQTKASIAESRKDIAALREDMGAGARFAEAILTSMDAAGRARSDLATDGGFAGAVTGDDGGDGEDPLTAGISFADASDEIETFDTRLARLTEERNEVLAKLERSGAAERERIAQQEYEARLNIASKGMELISNAVQLGIELQHRQELTGAQKSLIISLNLFSQLLRQLATYLGVKAGAALASQNYAQAAAFAVGAGIAGAGAEVISSQAQAIGEDSAAAANVSSSGSASNATSGFTANGGQSAAVDAPGMLEELQKHTRLLTIIAATNGPGGAIALAFLGDERNNGSSRRARREASGDSNLRAGFAG